MTLVGYWTARQLCLAVGFIYPLYKSSRALRRQDKHELVEWTTFWTTNALFWAVELVGDAVISWVPFYYEAKIALLFWLVLPQYRGARVLHDKWLAPTFEKHEEVIDVAITDIKRRASGMVMQVCKDTAAIAIKRGSGVMAQGQQYVATQLVQQAMGRLSQPGPGESTTQEVPVPAIMSFFATTATASSSPPTRKSIAVPPLLSEAKESPLKQVSVDEKNDSDAKSSMAQARKAKEIQAKAEAKAEAVDTSAKADEVSQAKKPRSPKRGPGSPQKTKDAASLPPTPPGTRMQDKSKELLTHFKKLMVKGFKLSYYPSEGDAKSRSLSLASPQSRYLMFESSSAADPAKPKKSVKMFILNMRRIAACKIGEEGIPATIDETRAFALDNGKSILVFEAESTKTRDLLVAGMRLLVNEHKRQDTIALNALTYWLEKTIKQRAFVHMVDTLAPSAPSERVETESGVEF